MAPRFKIVSEDGVNVAVLDTVTGYKLSVYRVQFSASFDEGVSVTLELAAGQVAIDVAAGYMEDDPEAAPDESPQKPRPLS